MTKVISTHRLIGDSRITHDKTKFNRAITPAMRRILEPQSRHSSKAPSKPAPITATPLQSPAQQERTVSEEIEQMIAMLPSYC